MDNDTKITLFDYFTENEEALRQFLARTYPSTNCFDLLLGLMNEGLVGIETLESLIKGDRYND